MPTNVLKASVYLSNTTQRKSRTYKGGEATIVGLVMFKVRCYRVLYSEVHGNGHRNGIDFEKCGTRLRYHTGALAPLIPSLIHLQIVDLTGNCSICHSGLQHRTLDIAAVLVRFSNLNQITSISQLQWPHSCGFLLF